MIKIEKVENNIDLITLKNDELEVVVSNYDAAHVFRIGITCIRSCCF